MDDPIKTDKERREREQQEQRERAEAELLDGSMQEFIKPSKALRYDPETVRQLRVRQLFAARTAKKRTGDGILNFYGWLWEHHPELLPRAGRTDPYQLLKSDLSGLYK